MFKHFKDSPESRLFEEQIYAQVVGELAQGMRRDGLWAKALAESDAKEEKAKSLYIKYRVQSIKDEIAISEKIKKIEKERQANKAEIEKRIEQKEAQAKKDADSPIFDAPMTAVKETLIKYRLLFVNTESALFHKHFVFSGYVMSVSRSIQWPVRPISATCRSSYH
ncbi:hypothetical protein, partial [Allochromatium palmeri]